eukprot:gb/GFBE01009887.1/.p1 GENE.gb/GFBE01009887.1/~~gb/GFBE01009887.1/.p1  ORF type:complete len:208 (+),score=40.75 gb/GFBE01009887.1/:1-624(+)
MAAQWFVVWCHERSLKPQRSGMRQMLKHMVDMAGGTLLCIKKAATFVQWLSANTDKPIVLLTDWREVKPIFEGMTTLAFDYRQLNIHVLAETPKEFERVILWSTYAMPMPAVQVCPVLTADYIRGMIAALFANQLPGPPLGEVPDHFADAVNQQSDSGSEDEAAVQQRAETQHVPELEYLSTAVQDPQRAKIIEEMLRMAEPDLYED